MFGSLYFAEKSTLNTTDIHTFRIEMDFCLQPNTNFRFY